MHKANQATFTTAAATTDGALGAAHCVAALASAIGVGADGAAPSRVVVLPDGGFAAHDGRPGNLAGVAAKQWRLDAAAAAALIARFEAVRLALPLDYEHQTLKAASNGLPAPAAAWITALAYEPGRGLVASLEWTAAGRAHVESGQYKYLSPVFLFDPASGVVTLLHSVALTNTPGLNTLPPLSAAALQSFFNLLPHAQPDAGSVGGGVHLEHTMDKTAVLVALGLPQDASDQTALTALAALSSQMKAKDDELAELRGNQFDSAKHIPLSEYQKATQALAALQAAQDGAVHSGLMTAALGDGRIFAANEAYWRAQPLAALQEFLKTAQPLAALVGTQTGGKASGLAGSKTAALTADQQGVLSQMGLSADDYAKAEVN